MKETQTYVLVSMDKVEVSNIIGCHRVFALKCGPDGSVECYKVRIVAKGFSQAYQVDYDETFTPVIKWDSICILLALSAQLDLEIHQMDMKTTFLNRDLDHMIYMDPPPGSPDFGVPGIVWKLEKSLYGLKQVSCTWYQKVKLEFSQLGFIQCDTDYYYSIFVHSRQDGTFCIIALYVDNLMILSNSLDTHEGLQDEGPWGHSLVSGIGNHP